MHSLQIVETAARIARSSATETLVGWEVSESDLQSYWIAAKCRLDRWQRVFCRSPRGQQTDVLGSSTTGIHGWIAEVLAAEVLTRVCAAVGCASDRENGEERLGPIVSSVYSGHLENRRRALRMCLASEHVGHGEVEHLDRLRRSCERWTDILLSFMQNHVDVRKFAFDIDRLHDFAEGHRQEYDVADCHFTWPLFMSSLQQSFQRFSSIRLPNFDLNAQVDATALATFRHAGVESSVDFELPWWQRMMDMADQTSDLITRLVQDDNHSVP